MYFIKEGRPKSLGAKQKAFLGEVALYLTFEGLSAEKVSVGEEE